MEAKLNKKLIKSLTKKTSANQPRLIKHVKDLAIIGKNKYFTKHAKYL